MHDGTAPQSGSSYARQLRRDLPAELFRRSPVRLLWLPLHLGVIGLCVAGVLDDGLAWGWKLVLSALIGHSYGCLMFLAHEILHGTVVKNPFWQNAISGLCMLPYCIGPAHWKAWHNHAHHGHTSVSGADPDSFGNITMYLRNRVLQWTLRFAPGSGYLRSWLFLGFWFSFHALVTLFIHSRRYDYWSPERRRRQIALFVAEVGFWCGVLAVVGPLNFLFVYALPMIVANMLQMSYIATNHLFCDETEDVNDPLANSLSVSVPRWLGWVHLNFGYHVEHHIFPYMNPRHAPHVRSAIEARYGTRYRTLPLWKALQILYRTPPVHLSAKELVDVGTGAVFHTLGEHGELPVQFDQVPVPVRPRRRPQPLRLLVPASDAEPAAPAAVKPADADIVKRAA